MIPAAEIADPLVLTHLLYPVAAHLGFRSAAVPLREFPAASDQHTDCRQACIHV